MVSETTTTGQQQTTSWFTLRNLALVLILAGSLVSLYLSYSKFTGGELACIEASGFDCGGVQNSIYAEIMGIPIAYLGLLSYLFLGALILLENRLPILLEYGHLLVLLLTLAAWVYSMYLVYLQVIVLEALCQWCLFHEVTITVLLVVVGVRFLNYINRDDF